MGRVCPSGVAHCLHCALALLAKSSSRCLIIMYFYALHSMLYSALLDRLNLEES